MKNKYAYRSRISEAKIRQIVKLFTVGLDVSQIAEILIRVDITAREKNLKFLQVVERSFCTNHYHTRRYRT